MKMKCLIIAMLFSIPVFAQTSQRLFRDSLKLSLQKEIADTGKVYLLAAISTTYSSSKPDSALYFATQGYNLARSIGFKVGEAKSLNKMAQAWSMMGENTKALELYTQALKIGEATGNDKIQVAAIIGIGVQTQYEDARQRLEYYLKAKVIADRMNDDVTNGRLYLGVSRAYFNLRKFDSGQLWAHKAFFIARSLPEGVTKNSLLASALTSIGGYYSNIGQTNFALEHWRLCIPYYIDTENISGEYQTYLDMAWAFKQLKNEDSVFHYASKVFNHTKDLAFPTLVINSSNLLYLHYKGKRADSALYYFEINRSLMYEKFGKEEQAKVERLLNEERKRQEEIEKSKLQAAKDRATNLQFAAIAIGIITLVIVFLLLSHSVIVTPKVIKYFGIFALLLVFEFINLYLHPIIGDLTHHSPIIMLLIMVVIAALLVPLHHKLEHIITHKLIEKNNKIRLKAAKATIEEIEKITS